MNCSVIHDGLSCGEIDITKIQQLISSMIIFNLDCGSLDQEDVNSGASISVYRDVCINVVNTAFANPIFVDSETKVYSNIVIKGSIGSSTAETSAYLL